jgi:uncharacterized protein HemY
MVNGSTTDNEQAIMDMIADGALGRHFGFERKHLDAAAFIAGDLARRGAHDKAVRLFATIVLCDPHHRVAQIGLASGALEVEQPYIAIQAAATLIAGEPQNPLGYLLSGKGCLMAQEWPEAGEDLHRALELARAGGDAALATEAERLLAALPSAPPAPAAEASAIRFG